MQVHLYYDDLIEEIVNKTNNIPIFFDLYISTDSLYKKNKIIDYIKTNSKSKNVEIMVLENKGRDVMPLLIQMKNKIKKYKYIKFCFVNSSFPYEILN